MVDVVQKEGNIEEKDSLTRAWAGGDPVAIVHDPFLQNAVTTLLRDYHGQGLKLYSTVHRMNLPLVMFFFLKYEVAPAIQWFGLEHGHTLWSIMPVRRFLHWIGYDLPATNEHRDTCLSDRHMMWHPYYRLHYVNPRKNLSKWVGQVRMVEKVMRTEARKRWLHQSLEYLSRKRLPRSPMSSRPWKTEAIDELQQVLASDLAAEMNDRVTESSPTLFEEKKYVWSRICEAMLPKEWRYHELSNEMKSESKNEKPPHKWSKMQKSLFAKECVLTEAVYRDSIRIEQWKQRIPFQMVERLYHIWLKCELEDS